MSRFSVRPMEKRDIPAWGEMRCALWPDEDEQEMREELDDLLDLASEYHGWIIIDEAGEPAGFAEASVRNIVDGCKMGPAAYLEAIWIVPDRRRSGLANLLLDAIVYWAKERGLNEMGSDCSVDNGNSQAWHQAMGFSETGRSVNFKRILQ